MNVETIREYCLSKRGVTESFPFDDVSLVIKVMNKMFALIDLEEANHIALKCDPEKAIELREHYSGIEGAYHFNKKYWNSVRFDSDVDDKLMKELIDHSYDEVIKNLLKSYAQNMMPSLDTFPVPLIHINETNSTNNYLQSLCSEQKVEELTVIVADFKLPVGDSVEIRGNQILARIFFSAPLSSPSFWKHDVSFLFHRLYL